MPEKTHPTAFSLAKRRLLWTVLYVKKGATLTVKGGDGRGTESGGAGIRVDSGSTLIVTGGGTLNVTGGNAGNGLGGGGGGGGGTAPALRSARPEFLPNSRDVFSLNINGYYRFVHARIAKPYSIQ